MKLLSKHCRRRRGPASLTFITWLGLGLGLGLGASGCASEVNLAAESEAINGCEAPSADNLNPEAPMLPGRHCIGCHKAGGQASRRAWVAAGTVYASPTSSCNTQGLEGVKVEIADTNRKVLMTLYTNRTGNFFTAEQFDTSNIIARITGPDGKYKEMQAGSSNGSADCGSCHFPGGVAGGRIYLN